MLGNIDSVQIGSIECISDYEQGTLYYSTIGNTFDGANLHTVDIAKHVMRLLITSSASVHTLMIN